MRASLLDMQRCSTRVKRQVGLVVRAAKTADGPAVAIVGVTGAVGQEFLRVRVSNHSSLLVQRAGIGMV